MQAKNTPMFAACFQYPSPAGWYGHCCRNNFHGFSGLAQPVGCAAQE